MRAGSILARAVTEVHLNRNRTEPVLIEQSKLVDERFIMPGTLLKQGFRTRLLFRPLVA